MATDDEQEIAMDSSSVESVEHGVDLEDSGTMNRTIDDGLIADRSLERATLTRRNARRLQAQYR